MCMWKGICMSVTAWGGGGICGSVCMCMEGLLGSLGLSGAVAGGCGEGLGGWFARVQGVAGQCNGGCAGCM